VGARELDPKAVLERLAPGGASGESLPASVAPKPRPQAPHTIDRGIEVKGLSGMMVAFARCCSPVSGDSILGYVTVGRGVSIHRADCVNAPDLLRKSERLVEVRWAGAAEASRPVELEVAAWDRPNLMAEMLLAIARTTSPKGHNSNLSAAAASALEGGLAQARFTVEIFDLEHLKRLMLNLYQVEGVTSVKRLDKRLKKRASRPSETKGAMDASDSA
jgi:GTP pyrophosphokinase